MRIIAGEHRGRKLIGPEGEVTRPITDRVKQSLFDIVTPLLEGARVYDCFAGTGSMGLECLSRGAEKATFFETDRGALVGLKKNIEAIRAGSAARVVAGDLFKWFGEEKNRPVERVDLIFLDPPYRFLGEKSEELRGLVERMVEGHLKEEGTIVFRHDAGDKLEMPGVRVYDERVYGGMALEFLRPGGRREG